MSRSRRKKSVCPVCNKEYFPWAPKALYCSSICSGEARGQETWKLWISGEKIPQGAGTIRRHLKKYYKGECSVCRITSWNNKTLVMEIDHIDGNSLNNQFENLRIICPNCHSQTPNFKSKNRGNGRYKRAQRYKNGDSY